MQLKEDGDNQLAMFGVDLRWNVQMFKKVTHTKTLVSVKLC